MRILPELHRNFIPEYPQCENISFFCSRENCENFWRYIGTIKIKNFTAKKERKKIYTLCVLKSGGVEKKIWTAL